VYILTDVCGFLLLQFHLGEGPEATSEVKAQAEAKFHMY
jgi:hypothetical protein